ncbi:hypothetical protein PCASD_22128 [Puccinia coronata f. sp. avenae]|uniref:Uncharacterized protein n=1 Tax=Puccinia coronata f. sp. avenae TaxID=200324 RepID=A0A2N5TNT8_9BASI|nr:hypothetical protein PCASD_22128 [Puccinia coronata f. sp. avenae]
MQTSQNAVQALPPTLSLYHSCWPPPSTTAASTLPSCHCQPLPSTTVSGPHPLPQPQLLSTSASSALYASPSRRYPSKTELPAPAALFRSQRIPATMAKPCPLPQPQPTLALYQSLWHLPSTSATAALLASPSSC